MTSPASRLYSRLPSARSHSMATPSCNHHTPLSNTVQQEVHKQLGVCTLPKLCTATDGELHLQEPVLVHRLRRLQQTSTCYLLPLEAERKIVCLLLPESEQDIVTKPQLVRWVMTARCALIILAECPGICSVVQQKQHANAALSIAMLTLTVEAEALKQQLLPRFKRTSAIKPWSLQDLLCFCPNTHWLICYAVRHLNCDKF